VERQDARQTPSQRNGMRMPLAKPVLRCDRHLQLIVGGLYGYTRSVGDRKKFHGGIDLYAEPGTTCFAIYDGAVESVLKGDDFGNFVIARVDLPQWTCWAVYAHLSKVLVTRGTKLEPGTVIGLTGTTGNSSPHYPHLHFEIWRTLDAGQLGTREKYRIDPLKVLGAIPLQPFAAEVIEWNTTRA
jgi:murein DD-endopeptidase MepM/ murein hydrolase activator NlpD